MNRSQNWHTNLDGLESSFFLPFYFFNFFVSLFIIIVFFLFKLVKLVRLIKPIRVNDPSLICIFVFFRNAYVTLAYVLTFKKIWVGPRRGMGPLFSKSYTWPNRNTFNIGGVYLKKKHFPENYFTNFLMFV
jgi:hypothetical protein